MSAIAQSRYNLRNAIAPIFWGLHTAIRNETHSDFWVAGGRGSLKSSTAALEIIEGIVNDPTANGLCVRKVGDTLRDSCLATLTWAIDTLQLSMFFKVTKSPASITYKVTGQQILFKGLDDPLKLKSIKVRSGYIKFLWFEEAAELDGPEEMRSVQQSVKRGGSRFVEFVTYNPPRQPDHWINVEFKRRLENKREGHYAHFSTYKDVPPEWLGPVFLKEAAELERDNPIAYAHEYLGESVGRSEAMIFGGNTKVRAFEAVRREGGVDPFGDQYMIDGVPVAGPYNGADFGFSDDPATLLRCFIDDTPGRRKRLYVEYEACEKGIMYDATPTQDGYAEFYDRVPDSRKYKIWADCSQPATIAHIKAKGFNIEGAEKWPGSIEEGIKFLQNFDIIIHPRCTNMIKEARLYCYKIDRLTQQVTADIIDKFNHSWDAVRYALALMIKPKPKGFFS